MTVYVRQLLEPTAVTPVRTECCHECVWPVSEFSLGVLPSKFPNDHILYLGYWGHLAQQGKSQCTTEVFRHLLCVFCESSKKHKYLEENNQQVLFSHCCVCR